MSSGWKLSDETRTRMRATWTPERKAAHSARQTGRVVTDETRSKISQSMRNTWKRKREAVVTDKEAIRA